MIQLPSELAPAQTGNNICYLKYADPKSNEQLLVLMTYGEVYLLDTVSETFQQLNGSYAISTVEKYSTIEIKD
jgi:hypothetical protein